MHRKYFSAVLALSLLSLLLILVFFLKPSPPKEQENLAFQPSPFNTFINGTGIVEPKSGNIYIGNPFNRIIQQIHVSVNDHVKKGDILFQLDHLDLIANQQIKQKEYDKALANLHRLEAFPRTEDLIIAEEAVKQAQASLNGSKSQYEMAANLANPRAISKEDLDRRLYKYLQDEAELKERQAQLNKVQSGTWQPDLIIARHEADQAKAAVEAIETEIGQISIKAPIDGTVLQIKIHEGETTSSDPFKTVMIIGDLEELFLRVSIDQFDIPHLLSTKRAIAYRRGDRLNQFPLEFIRIEPFIIPKQYLTNNVSEKIDSQVLEILYRITKNQPRLFIGEQMDVFIETENN